MSEARPAWGQILMPLPGLHLIMKRKYLRFALANLTLISSLVCEAQSSRPDLSRIWLLDREKSDLKSPPIDTDQSRKPGTGGGGGAPRPAVAGAWAEGVAAWVVADEAAGEGWEDQRLARLAQP
jgi:hypothetical protein